MYKDKPLLHQRQKEHKPGNLRTISLDVTSACNMKCSKCYAQTFVGIPLVGIEVLKEAADEAYGLGVYHYILQGGEPIVDPGRLEAILRIIHPDETYINVVSNGWAMTPGKIRWLRDLKVDKICFSLDSGLEGEHDQERGAGSWRRVLRAIDDVLSEGLLTSISVVVTHQSLNSEGFRKAYLYAEQKRIRIDVQIAEPVGRWDGRRDLLLTPDDTRAIKALQEKGPRLPNGQLMLNRDLYTGDTDHCPAGREFMAIASDGTFLPCNFLQYSLGNIRERRIADMRADLIASSWFDGRHPVCLCGEDSRFIETFVMPHVNVPKPLDAYSIFGLPGGPRHGTV